MNFIYLLKGLRRNYYHSKKYYLSMQENSKVLVDTKED